VETLREPSLVAALVTTGLMAGIYLAFAISVLPGLGRTDDRTFVAAMRGMNAAILNPLFFVVFLGPLPLGILALVARLPDHDGMGWVVLALVLYAGTLGITAAVNVPLNNRLDDTDPGSENQSTAREIFERRWSTWNVVRTLLCAASFVSLVPALS
jgi:uncharacterized membrane protein